MPTIQQTRHVNGRHLMQLAGGPLAFSQKIQREPSYVSHILGPSPSKAIGDRMARHIEASFGKHEGWLDEVHAFPTPPPARVEASLAKRHSEHDFVTLPVVDVQTSDAGEPELTVQARIGGVPRDALQRQGITEDDALLVEVHGDAHGMALPDGSLVAINTQDAAPKEGKLYAIQDAEMLRVRVLVPQPGGGLILRTYNRDDYPDESLDADATQRRITVLGRVFWSATHWG